MKTRSLSPEFVVRDGEPVAVIIDIDQYRELLELLEDVEDLKALEEMRKDAIEFRRLDEFLDEYTPDA